ncbi:hypothetical protein BGM26_06405, partial [Bacillus sp. FJAT-29790]|uniref:hypothetical protein n=1 Tax=Bacillus sp. FJAT-29790 TaxID=1895002 RepID=UPI001C2445D8
RSLYFPQESSALRSNQLRYLNKITLKKQQSLRKQPLILIMYGQIESIRVIAKHTIVIIP